MKNKYVYILIIFIIGLVCGFIFSTFLSRISIPTSVPVQSLDNTSKQASQQDNRFNVETIQEDTAENKIVIKYPQLVDKQIDPSTINLVNKAIKKIIEDELNTFKKGFMEYNSSTGEFKSVNIPQGSDIQNTLGITYEIANYTDSLLSLEIQSQIYFNGAAHPFHNIFTYNYDFKKQKIISITDLFDPKNMDKLSSLVITKLMDNFKTKGQFDGTLDSWIKGGASSDIKNYGHFLIKKDGLEILFDEYQVASYADGQPRVFIPYNEIKDIISYDYIFLIKN